MLMTESERRLDELITGAGFKIADLGVDRDQAWVKFYVNGKYELVTASYDVGSTDETVADAIVVAAKQRGILSRNPTTA